MDAEGISSSGNAHRRMIGLLAGMQTQSTAETANRIRKKTVLIS